MKGSECKFVKYMEGSDKRFVIPVYQRNYDWKTENCKQLYDDLVKIIKGGRKSHFFGSLVSVYNPDGHNEEFLIIDGQQRLTTVSLLFLAMYNLIDKGTITPETSNLKQRIYEEYLVDKWKPEDTRIKLKPVKNDQKAFGKLFDDPDEHIRESNLTVNYEYFYERIQKEEITIDQLYDAICCLEIINIRLDKDDNPQLIFESLNSTGLDLSEGDKIRNFILMGLPSKEQEDYYEKYWNRIEVCTKYDVSAFIRDYLSVKQQAIPQQKKIYTTFKDFVELTKMETEPLLSEMLAYAKRYQILLEGNTGSKELNACIYRLNRLETTVTRPYFLEVLRLYDESKLTLSQVTESENKSGVSSGQKMRIETFIKDYSVGDCLCQICGLFFPEFDFNYNQFRTSVAAMNSLSDESEYNWASEEQQVEYDLYDRRLWDYSLYKTAIKEKQKELFGTGELEFSETFDDWSVYKITYDKKFLANTVGDWGDNTCDYYITDITKSKNSYQIIILLKDGWYDNEIGDVVPKDYCDFELTLKPSGDTFMITNAKLKNRYHE